MSNNQLAITNVITVSLANVNAGLNAPNTGNLLLLTPEVPGPTFTGAYQAYVNSAQPETDFGTYSETAAMAESVFSQQPNILLPGGQLLVVPFLPGAVTLTFSAVAASGSFEVTYGGNSSASIAWDATLSTIQSSIQAIAGLGSVTVTGSIASQSLVITMSGIYAPTAVTISSNTLEDSGSSAVTVTPSVTTAAETLAAAITRANGFLNFFGVIGAQIFDQTDTLAAAAVVQPLSILLAVVSNNSSDLTASTGTFAQVVSGGYSHTRCLYYGANVVSLNPSAVPASGTFTVSYGGVTSSAIAYNAAASTIQTDLQAIYGLGSVTVSGSLLTQNLQIQMIGTQGPSKITATSSLADSNSNAVSLSVVYQQSDPLVYLAGYISSGLSVVFTGSNTTITMNLKQIVGVLPDLTIDQTVQDECTVVGADTYPSIAGDPAVLSAGANLFFDQAQNRIWFATAISIAGYNYLAQTNTKIPQTENGMTGLKTAYKQVCKQSVVNQYIAPGQWNSSSTFGNQALFLANITNKGYYIYSTPIASQSEATRQTRAAPLVQIAVKEAGAIHSSAVLVNVEA